MASDDLPRPVTAEVALDAMPGDGPGAWSWTDVTADVLVEGQKVVIGQGRPDGFSVAPPTKVSSKLNNSTGRWSEFNPTGDWYGRIRQGTPLRFTAATAARPTYASDPFTRTVSNSWGVEPVTLQTYVQSGSSGVASSDFQVTGTTATHSVAAANGFRRTRILAPTDVELSVQVSFALPTGAALEAGFTMRESVGSSYYLCRVSVAPTTNAITAQIVTIAPDATLTAVATGLTHAAGTPIKMRARVDGTAIFYRVWQGAVEPSNWTATATSSQFTTAGYAGARSGRATSNTNSPAVITYDNLTVTTRADLGSVYLDELPTEWDPNSTEFATVPATASGIFRQLGQGDDVVPPLVRSWTAQNRPQPVAYWRLDDATGSTGFASDTEGIAPATVAGTINYAADNTLDGSGPMTVMASGGFIQGFSGLSASAAAPMAGLRWISKIPSSPGADVALMHAGVPGGTVRGWVFRIIDSATDGIRVEGYDNTDTLITSGLATLQFTYGSHALFRFNVTQNGGNIDWNLDVYTFDETLGSLLGTGVSGSVAGTVGNIHNWYTIGFPELVGVSLGHAVIVNDTAHSTSDEAPWGYPGETDTARIAAVCAEAGIPCDVSASTPGVPLGPRPLANTLAILRDAEAAGGGILYERNFGVSYVALSQRYNRTPALILDNTIGQVCDIKTANDDQGRRNDVTVTRTNGGKARAQDLAHIARYRRYAEPLTLNLDAAAQAADAAYSRVVQGTVLGDRVPQLTADLFARPELINAWVACTVGSLIRVVGAPMPLPPDDLDLELQGWKLTCDGVIMLAEMNTSRADPWAAGVLDGGRLDSDATTLTADITSTATSFQVTITDGSLWTTSGAQFPMVVRMGGEDIRLSAISGGSSPQTFTVDPASGGGRGVNGVRKAHTAGTSIHVHDRIRLAR